MSSVGLLLQILILYKLMGLFNCHRQKKTPSASFLPDDFFLRVVGWRLQEDKIVQDNKERINRINSKKEIRTSRKTLPMPVPCFCLLLYYYNDHISKA